MSAQPIAHTDLLLDHEGPWTEEDYLALGEIEGARVELFDGDLVMSPVPDSPHQRLVGRLWSELDRQLPDGFEALPGGNVRLATGRINIPDVLVREIADVLVHEAADVPLVAEIVSPWGKARDRILKPVAYAEAGIRWYLRVERAPRLELILHRLDGDQYVKHATAGPGEFLEVPDLAVTIEVDALLRRRG